jgi:hypothetical protein
MHRLPGRTRAAAAAAAAAMGRLRKPSCLKLGNYLAESLRYPGSWLNAGCLRACTYTCCVLRHSMPQSALTNPMEYNNRHMMQHLKRRSPQKNNNPLPHLSPRHGLLLFKDPLTTSGAQFSRRMK